MKQQEPLTQQHGSARLHVPIPCACACRRMHALCLYIRQRRNDGETQKSYMVLTEVSVCGFSPVYCLGRYSSCRQTYSVGQWGPVPVQRSGCLPLVRCLSLTSVDHTASPGRTNTVHVHRVDKGSIQCWLGCFTFLRPTPPPQPQPVPGWGQLSPGQAAGAVSDPLRTSFSHSKKSRRL